MEYHFSVNVGSDPKSGLEIKKFLLDMPFLEGYGHSTHKNMQDRLD